MILLERLKHKNFPHLKAISFLGWIYFFWWIYILYANLKVFSKSLLSNSRPQNCFYSTFLLALVYSFFLVFYVFFCSVSLFYSFFCTTGPRVILYSLAWTSRLHSLLSGYKKVWVRVFRNFVSVFLIPTSLTCANSERYHARNIHIIAHTHTHTHTRKILICVSTDGAPTLAYHSVKRGSYQLGEFESAR